VGDRFFWARNLGFRGLAQKEGCGCVQRNMQLVTRHSESGLAACFAESGGAEVKDV